MPSYNPSPNELGKQFSLNLGQTACRSVQLILQTRLESPRCDLCLLVSAERLSTYVITIQQGPLPLGFARFTGHPLTSAPLLPSPC